MIHLSLISFFYLFIIVFYVTLSALCLTAITTAYERILIKYLMLRKLKINLYFRSHNSNFA